MEHHRTDSADGWNTPRLHCGDTLIWMRGSATACPRPTRLSDTPMPCLPQLWNTKGQLEEQGGF